MQLVIMIKKNFIPLAIAGLMGLGGYFAQSTTANKNGLSNLELANAEALANNEGSGVIYPCYNSYVTDPGMIFVYCENCEIRQGRATGPVSDCTL